MFKRPPGEESNGVILTVRSDLLAAKNRTVERK